MYSLRMKSTDVVSILWTPLILPCICQDFDKIFSLGPKEGIRSPRTLKSLFSPLEVRSVCSLILTEWNSFIWNKIVPVYKIRLTEDSCENSDASFCSIKSKKFLAYLRSDWLVKENRSMDFVSNYQGTPLPVHIKFYPNSSGKINSVCGWIV